jgi:hypothetical protein
MKPKSRKEILDVCQSNFLNYSTLTKVAIIIAVVLSAGALSVYLCGYILPTIQGVVYGEIVGWDLVWRVCLAFLYYAGLHFVNLFCVSLGGATMCREENWDINDFSMAWMNMYKYVSYIETEEEEELEDLDDENSEK